MFKQFKRIDAFVESIIFLNTHLNKLLITAIACKCPKFKHVDQTMTPTTQITVVAAIQNCGCEAFH